MTSSPSLSLHPRVLDALAFLAGASLVLAFAPFALRPFAVFAPAILFLIWSQDSPESARRHGYLFGLGQFGLGVYWIYHSLHLFGSAIGPVAGVVTLLFVMILALYPAVLGWLLRRYAPARPGIFLLLTLPAAWMLWEWFRGWFLTGFPWLYLGHAQVDTWLGGLAPVFGVLGASLAAGLIAGVLAYAWWARGWWRIAVLVLAVAVWGGAGMLGNVSWTRPLGEPMTVSLVQGSIAQARKWDPEQFEATLNLYRDLTRERWGDDLIVWPETAVPTFVFEVYDDYLKPLREEAESQETDLLIGIFSYDPDSRDIYNSVISWGSTVGIYNKRHLVPFGEYLPLRGLLGWLDGLIEIPMSDLSAGEGRPLLEAAGYPVGISICYEDAYGEEVIDALPEAALLVNVSNDAWFGPRQAPHQHLEIARMRSVETGRYLLRATNTGISAVIDDAGRIVDTLPQSESEPGVLTVEVQPRTGSTPYVRWGNWVVVTLALLLLTAGVVTGRRRSS